MTLRHAMLRRPQTVGPADSFERVLKLLGENDSDLLPVVEPDGSLSHRERYYLPLRLLPGRDRPGSDGMAVDTNGRLYVTTSAGVQMFDPTGRMGGVIGKPHRGSLANVVFGGPKRNMMYVTAGDRVYRRKTKVQGVAYFLKSPSP